ncbi:MAG TPA: tetratricopeptide repeat protein [Pyrinomonadaceae bacterium]|jgi:tetratricopeptide (TPR) repeat protein|nr:tetratricopeptide repeat protein [Pyrinomonadaceae bacterium]
MFYARLASLVFAVSACSLACPVSTAARTQTPGAQPTPAPRSPRPLATATPAPKTTAQPAAQQASLTPRERRVKAYAKLMEGQRFFTNARGRGGITREDLHTAQAAFEQAAALDPTLSEAHTALAEIAFFFLDDQTLAEREATAAVRIDNNNFGAHRILSRIYALKAGLDSDKTDRAAADRAIAALKDVLRLDPNDPEALALLGEFYTRTERETEAIEAFRRWMGAPATVDTNFYKVITQGRELSPDAAAARLAEALLKAGRTAESVDAIRRALAISPENSAYLALLGEAIDAGGDSDVAISELQRMIVANPTNLAAISLLAHTQARSGKVDAAVATLRAATAARPGDTRELQQQRSRLVDDLAGVLADALRYDEAIATYEEQLKARGVAADAPLTSDSDREAVRPLLERIINLQRQAGRLDDAFSTAARMRRVLGANDPRADFYSIAVLREQGKRREALEAARAARLKHPGVSEFLSLEAETLAELGQVEEGATLLRARVTGKVEDDYPAYLSIANLYLQAGRGKEAVVAARKLLELAPPTQPQLVAQALIMLASAQERAGDPKGAEESLRRILSKTPNDATALNNLGYFLTERGERLPDALDMIKRAVKAEPTNPNYLDSLGWVYFKLGQLDEAERYLNDAARRNTRSSTVHEHLGDLYQKRGKLDDARAAWRKALGLTTDASDITRLKAKINGEASK